MPESVVTLRDPAAAQRLLVGSLWLQRVAAPSAASLRPALELALEILSGGQPIPAPYLLADLASLLGSPDRFRRPETPVIPGVPPALPRAYEDLVLGKLEMDRMFERAIDAVRRFQGRDRWRGLAYVVKQLRDRAGVGGFDFSPGIVRNLLDQSAEELWQRSWESVQAEGVLPELIEHHDELVAGVRRLGDALAPEDIVALEHRTALADLGQYVAHRQILQAARRFEEPLSRYRLKPYPGRQEVATRILQEDAYPVGGFSSISTRGSIESLLHSQLAYMESDPALQPDLFDIKFLRDELYYYARDENQFLRKRRGFVWTFSADMVETRFKDPVLPFQRVVLTMGLMLASVRRLADWLGTDALRFEICFPLVEGAEPLAHEAELAEMIFRDLIQAGLVFVRRVTPEQAVQLARESHRQSMSHACRVGASEQAEPADYPLTQLVVDGSTPRVTVPRRGVIRLDADEPFEAWAKTLEHVLRLWI